MSLLNTVGLKGIKLSTRRNFSRLNWIPNYCFLIKTIQREGFVDFCTIKPNKVEKSSTIRTPVKSVNSNFTLAVRSPKFGQAKTHFLSHYGEKNMTGPGFEPMTIRSEAHLANHYNTDA